MATVSDLTNTPVSGLNHIDALLDAGPDWNYLTSGGNTIYYTFSTASGNEQGETGQETFTVAQQASARTAFSYLQQITGIQFVETAIGTSAQIHLCNINLEGSGTTGLCSWSAPYSYNPSNNVVSEYKVDAYVYLDNVEWRAQNRDLTPGGSGYQTLLHELGHALGLKHPFEDSVQLPNSQDNTSNTLMSYDDVGGPYSVFSSYDLAALKWLYGGDGLRGALGINSASGARYLTGTKNADVLTGTSANDVLEGGGGADVINGGAGQDTAVFSRSRASYSFSQNGSGDLLASNSIDGTATLVGIETVRFSDGTYQRAQLGTDTVAPAAPTFTVAHNQNNYALGNKPLITGGAEANATVRVYIGGVEMGSVKADAHGVWQLLVPQALADGLNYRAHATATDEAGNVSVASESVYFHVDGNAPVIPTGSVSLAAGSNQPKFSGTAEAGTTIQLFRVGDFTEIGRATAGADGSWSLDAAPMPNGSYEVRVVSVDKADNATSGAANVAMTIASSANLTGTAGKDTFSMMSGNNAVDGGAGIDVAVFGGAKSDYTVSKGVWGHQVTDRVGAGGFDSLVDVERVQFSDGWKALDYDGVAGQVYRLYQAVFDRAADTGGQGYWMSRMENGLTLVDMAKQFMTTPAPDGKIEFETLYGVNPSDSVFITKLYNNVLNRAPEEGGFNYWMGRITTSSREQILIEFSESPENQGNVIGLIANGIDYVPYG